MIEVNGPANIIYINDKLQASQSIDLDYIKETAQVTIEYMNAQNKDQLTTWHQVRDLWLKNNPNHSPLWDK